LSLKKNIIIFIIIVYILCYDFITEPLEELEEAVIEKQEAHHTTWLQIEALRDQRYWLPWKPDLEQGQTEEDCEDPERIVVFDDVKGFVFTMSEVFHYDLVLAVVELLGYRGKGGCGLGGVFAGVVERYSDSCLHVDHVVAQDRVDDLSGNNVLRMFVVKLLSQVILCFHGNERTALTTLMLEIELVVFDMDNLSKSDKKHIRKIVKQVLKEESNRNNLAIWCRYIEVERVIGKSGEAKSIAETALTMYGGKGIDAESMESNNLISLYTLYCSLLLGIENMTAKLQPKTAPPDSGVKRQVLYVVACLVEGNKMELSGPHDLSSASVLKVASKLHKLLEAAQCSLEKSATKLNIERLEALTWCYTLFIYCKSGLDAALCLITEIQHKCQQDSTKSLLRTMHRFKLQLINQHMAMYASPVSTLRDHLDQALHECPSDAEFLALFLDVERKSRISGRLNRFASSFTLTLFYCLADKYLIINFFTIPVCDSLQVPAILIAMAYLWSALE